MSDPRARRVPRRPKPPGRNEIIGQFAARPIRLLESPAYRVLSESAHKALSRLEIELAHHGGKDNGSLMCTYLHFTEYGVHPNAIGPAIRELEALGVIEVTERGAGGNADEWRASRYRLTYRHATGISGDGSHDYLKIATVAEAKAIARQARLSVNPRAALNGRKAEFHPRIVRVVPPSESEGGKAVFPPSDTDSTAPPSDSEGTSISREEIPHGTTRGRVADRANGHATKQAAVFPPPPSSRT